MAPVGIVDGAPGAEVSFDPATGDWAGQGTPAPAPDAPRKGVVPLLWTLLLGIDLALLGLALVSTIFLTLTGRSVAVKVDRATLWGEVAVNLLALGVIPFAWVVGTRVRAWEGAKRYLRLDRPLVGLVEGALWGLGAVGALLLLGSILAALHRAPSNPQADAILDAVTPALALALALGAAVGEEIFFRGLLQRWTGVWGQAVLFGLFHLSYGTVLQVLAPLALGLLLGWLVRRGAPLWTAMAAHFVFDYAQLGAKFLPLPHG